MSRIVHGNICLLLLGGEKCNDLAVSFQHQVLYVGC